MGHFLWINKNLDNDVEVYELPHQTSCEVYKLSQSFHTRSNKKIFLFCKSWLVMFQSEGLSKVCSLVIDTGKSLASK